MQKLHQLNFENTFANLSKSFHTPLKPTPLPKPYLISFNPSAGNLIDLDSVEATREDFAEHFSGNRLPPNAEPLAMLYAGHQFGHFVPQLGDGRAILLGEVRNCAGELWDVQLKGAGITPYSRQGDGRSVLRSSIREYLCSEAMHGLGIPTSRALCIVGSDEEVYRESIETAAVVTRLAPSHVRFGSFEVYFHSNQLEEITTLANYVIERNFSHLSNESYKYQLFLNEITLRTARLIANWQAVGFAHGVMNTDNMSILGLTLDYGPFGFMEAYNPSYICNHSDQHGRYAFDQQPQIGLWNLTCLALALSPLIPQEDAVAILDGYAPAFYTHYTGLMGDKLGLSNTTQDDIPLISSLLDMMQTSRLDYTNLFRSLGNFATSANACNDLLRDQFIDRQAFDSWATAYRKRLQSSDDATRKVHMDSVNPKYILRNYLAQIAIEKAENHRDYSEINLLLKLLAHPYEEQPEMEHYSAPPPEWAQHISISCSS